MNYSPDQHKIYTMKNILLIFAASLLALTAGAQNYITKNGKISFFSKTDVENIDAVNNQAVSVINAETGSVNFSLLVNGFLFKKALMQEHFNENYMESDKYPKATFKGAITDMGKINFKKEGVYNVTVTGDLNMHNVTNKVTIPAVIQVKGNTISANAVFKIKLEEYKISVPKVVENNISKAIELKVDCNYEAR
jgi:polyisoprenoid-binding protein YceI